MATRLSRIRFRGTLVDIGHRLTAGDIKDLAFIYLEEEHHEVVGHIDLMERMVKRDKLRDCQDDLFLLIESLEIIGRADLREIVSKYIERRVPPLNRDSSERLPDLEPAVQQAASLEQTDPHFGTEEAGRDANFTVSGLDGISPKKLAVCDSTSDSSDDTGSCASADDTTPEDVGKLVKRPQDLAERSGNAKTKASFLLKHKGADDMTPEDDTKFIKKAHDLAKRSGDEKTKVAAIIVDRKSKKIIGKGWNRFPKGCEDRFKWTRDKDKEPLEYGKHLYVVYAVKAAILYALDKKADLRDSILYTTLYPSNNCAQSIRETGVSEVVYDSDKFHNQVFMKASRRILEGIKCRQYSV